MRTETAPQTTAGPRSLVLASLLTALVAFLAFSEPARLTAQGDDPTATPGKIDPAILAALDDSPDGTVRVIIRLEAQSPLKNLAPQTDPIQRRQKVYAILRQTAETAQADLLQQIEKLADDGHVAAYRAFWIFNGPPSGVLSRPENRSRLP